MYWLLVLVALVCVHLYQRVLNRRQRKLLAHLPSWTPLPLIGSVYKFLADAKNAFKYYNHISAIYEATGQPFLVWVGHKGYIVLLDPEDIRAVSTTNLDKSYIYTFAGCVVGEGLITAPGAIWKRNIKKLRSAFKTSTINSYQETFNNQAQKLVQSFKAEMNGPPCNVRHKYLSDITFRALCESFIGVHCDKVVDDELTRSFVRASKLLADRAVNICLYSEAVFRLTSAYRELKSCMKLISNMTETVLNAKLNDMNKNGQDCGDKPTKSFLDILLEMKNMDPPMSDAAIKYELTTFLLAGHETIASALNMILLMLGSRTGVQQKLYDEIKCVFGNTKRPVLGEDLVSLSYCEAVILETLRLYPPVPGVLRYVDHDVQLESCTIPAGVTCFFFIWGSGRSKRIWGDDALEYKPERWLDTKMASKHAASLLSFSIGKRACVGKHYSMNLIKTILVHIIREYKLFSETDKMTFTIDILLHPKDKNLLEIRKRESI